MAKRTTKKRAKATTKKKTVKRKTHKPARATKKPVRTKHARKKPVKKTARKKPAKKAAKRPTSITQQTALREIKQLAQRVTRTSQESMANPARAARKAVGTIRNRIPTPNGDLARTIKHTLDKYVRILTEHTGYYKDVKRWTDTTVDKVIELSSQLDELHRQYLRMAEQYMRHYMRKFTDFTY